MARRLYRQGGGSGRASRSAITIATAGVALGIAIMIVSVSVVLGFKNEVQNKVIGIGNHIQILNAQSSFSSELLPIVLTDDAVDCVNNIPEVSHLQRFCQKTGMLKTEDSFQGVVFKGIDEEYNLDFLRKNLVKGSIDKPFSSSENTGNLVVSQIVARKLNLTVGRKVFAYFFDQKLRARRFTVTAIYATNMSDFDTRLVFCDYKTVHQLLGFEPDQISGAEIIVSDINLLPQISDTLGKTLLQLEDPYGSHYIAPTIQQSYPHIFAWLDLLDINAIVILILMLAVAGFTTISGLLIIILERTQFIGIMKALGTPNRPLRHLFILYATLIVGRGIIIGNILGIGLCLLQQHFGIFRLDATTYYVNTVPILMNLGYVVLISVITFIIANLALILPSLLVSHIQPAKSIRFE